MTVCCSSHWKPRPGPRAASSFPTRPRKSRCRAKSWRSARAKRLEDGRLQAIDVKVGDKVIYGKWSGTEVKLGGVDHVILKEEDLFGVVG